MASTEKPPGFLEKIGDRFFATLSKREGKVVEEDSVHLLNEQELTDLRRVERAAVWRAAAAGAFSGLLCAIVGLLAWPLLGEDPDHPGYGQWLAFFLVVTAVSIVISIAEIIWLYYDSLRSVHKLATIAGLDLYPGSEDNRAVRNSLIRAALEMPNPPTEESLINPLRETSKFKILLVSTAYKLKVTASSIIFKAVVGRIGGRVIARKYLDFFGMPVYALWDAVTVLRVMREARIRAMGPSAIEGLLDRATAGSKPGEAAQTAMLRAVGACVVSTADLHPNHVAMLRAIMRRYGQPSVESLDSSAAFLESLAALPAAEQRTVLQVLGIAMAIDGRLTPREKELYQHARRDCKLDESLEYPLAVRRSFRSGRPAEAVAFV